MLKEFVLELLRVAVLAAIPVVIISLEQGQVNTEALLIAVGIAVLKAIDRTLHESGMAEKGITRF